MRFNRMALAVRPLLKDPLDDPAQTLTTFLPTVVQTWKSLRSLSEGIDSAPQGSTSKP